MTNQEESHRFLQAVPPPHSVIKRDGRIAPFDIAKIRSAIARAGEAAGEIDRTDAERLAAQVVKVLSYKYP